jgi:hypothetical protein
MLLAGWLARVLGLVDISKPQGDRVLDTLEKMLARAHPSLVSARNVTCTGCHVTFAGCLAASRRVAMVVIRLVGCCVFSREGF